MPMLMRVQVQEGSFAARYFTEDPELARFDRGLLDWGALFEHELRKETVHVDQLRSAPAVTALGLLTLVNQPASRRLTELPFCHRKRPTSSTSRQAFDGLRARRLVPTSTLGAGSKRPRSAFTDTDINDLIEKRQTWAGSVSVYRPRNLPVPGNHFWIEGRRFQCLLECTNRREAARFEGLERERAKALVKATERSRRVSGDR